MAVMTAKNFKNSYFDIGVQLLKREPFVAGKTVANFCAAYSLINVTSSSCISSSKSPKKQSKCVLPSSRSACTPGSLSDTNLKLYLRVSLSPLISFQLSDCESTSSATGGGVDVVDFLAAFFRNRWTTSFSFYR